MNTTPPSHNDQAYIPGMCNINKAEVAYRRNAAYLFLAISVIMTAFLFAFQAPATSRVVLTFPVFITVLNFLQVKNRFCVMYASKGQQNATKGSKTPKTVEEEQASIDHKKANKMYAQAGVAALLFTVIALLI